MGSNKKNSEVVVDSFVVSCLYPGHIEPGFIPESNDYFALCEECQTTLLPGILIETLVTGCDPGRELLESEAATVLISAIGIYWAQYNLEVEPFIVTGMATEEIFPSPITLDFDVHVRQAEIAETLDSLAGFGHDEFGSLEEYEWWFLFARDMLTWQVMRQEPSGAEELLLGIQQKFAVLSAKNFEGFNRLVDRALVRMDSTGQLISYFRDGLLKSDLHERTYLPYEIIVDTDTSFWGFCDSEDLAQLIEKTASQPIIVRMRETVPNRSLEWKPLGCLLTSTKVEVEPVLEYDWDVYGKPDPGFEVAGHLVALEYNLKFKLCAVVPVKQSQLEDLVVLDESFDNFEFYLTDQIGRIHFPGEPWISGPGQDLRVNFLDDDSGFEETDAMDVVTYYDSPVFDVYCEPESVEVGWFRGSPWAV